MNNNSTVGQRIVGSVIGVLVGGAVVGGVILGIGLLRLSTVPFVERDPDSDSAVIIITGALGCFVGATIGAAAGATIAQKRSSRRSSFWRALLGAVVGMFVGVPCALTGFGILAAPILIVAGAVIGSGWKAKPPGTDLTGEGGA